MEAKKSESLNSSKSRRISGRVMSSIRKTFQGNEEVKTSKTSIDFKPEGAFRKTTSTNTFERGASQSKIGVEGTIDILGELTPERNNNTENLSNWRPFESFATGKEIFSLKKKEKEVYEIQ